MSEKKDNHPDDKKNAPPNFPGNRIELISKSYSDTLAIMINNNMIDAAYSLTSNYEDAEDLLQDTTVKVFDNKDKFTDNMNFKGWVLTIMKNIFIKNYKKIVRNQTIIDKTNTSEFDTPEAAYNSLQISKTIDSFPDEYRIPFSMHVQGFKYEEIAQSMNLPIGTVKSRIFLARRRIQELLKDYQY